MIHNLFQGQNPEYITFRFLSQQEIVIIRFFLEVHLPGNHSCACIIRSCSQCPRTEFLISFFEIGGSGFCRFFDVIALVYFIIDFQTVFLSGTFQKLPYSDCSGR